MVSCTVEWVNEQSGGGSQAMKDSFVHGLVPSGVGGKWAGKQVGVERGEGEVEGGNRVKKKRNQDKTKAKK